MYPFKLMPALSAPTKVRRRLRLFAAAATSIATAAVLTIGGVSGVSVADTVPTGGESPTVSADRLPTAQVNGVVWAQVTVGSTVYATGSFSAARPAGVALGGAGTVTRSNLLAFNITTGVLSTTFVHTLNAQGLSIAASPDGSRVYVGGQFTTVDGTAHSRIAAFSTATGALVASFAPAVNNSVRAIAVSSSIVYIGGDLSAVGGTPRARVAALTTAGALVAGWDPGADLPIDSLTLTPDGSRVIVGGKFTTLAGAPATGMGSVDATTGASEPWAANQVIKNSGTSAEISSLSSDATQVYGTGYFYTVGGTFEGRFGADPMTGEINWMNNCHGDTYDALPIGPVLYSVGHEHDCSDISSYSQDNSVIFSSTLHRAVAQMTTPNGLVSRHPIFPGGAGMGPIYHDFAGQPVSTQLNWYPAMTAGTYTGQGQAAWSLSGNSQYLSVGGEFLTVNGVGQQGLVRFAISSIAPNKVGPTTASSLTPLVYSQSAGTARVAWQATWDEDNTTLIYNLFRDNGATPIATFTKDSTFFQRPDLGFVDTGLTVGSSHSYKVTVTDPFGNSITSGSSTVTIGSASPAGYNATILGDGASHFWPLSEASGTRAIDRAGFSDVSFTGGITLGTPGPIAGSGATAATFVGGETTPPPSGTPPRSNPPVPNDTAGTIGTIPPGGSFSLEAWVKTTSTAGGGILNLGMYRSADSSAIDKTVYLDAAGLLHFGVQNNATKQTIDSATSYNDGAWHLIDATFEGTSARLYADGALVASSDSLVDDIIFDGYWRIGGDRLNGWTSAPAANYLAGTIGDAAVYPSALSPATVASHYDAGTGGVVLPNQPPTAAFTPSCALLACSVNGSASSDTDGSIVTYAWDFGDGATATGVTASHTYGAAASYPITLTVTDNSGATNAVTHSVAVVAGSTALANDTFNRTVTGGFGTASPAGGAWTSTGTVADLAVTPGAGTIALPAGGRAGAYLGTVSSTSVDVLTKVAFSRVPVAGNGYYAYVYARQKSATSSYQTRVRMTPGGITRISLSKFDGSGTEVSLTTEVSGPTLAVGTKLDVRVEATGISPTTLRVKVWLDSAAEPAAWTQTVTDSSAALQSAGRVGLEGYLSGATTNGPITATFSTFVANPV
ncbi:MAG: hypothetical protein QOF79_2706 [Actinomycetota bacterium]|nr:hypothetical protein [Actinomycetota bacterium]